MTAPVYAEVADKDPVTKMQYVDLHFWLVHDILMKGDKMGMANSVEVRVPFLDKKMWEFARTLPLEEKVNPPRTKVLFREAAQKRISKDTAQKKKLGFPGADPYLDPAGTILQYDRGAVLFRSGRTVFPYRPSVKDASPL